MARTNRAQSARGISNTKTIEHPPEPSLSSMKATVIGAILAIDIRQSCQYIGCTLLNRESLPSTVGHPQQSSNGLS